MVLSWHVTWPGKFQNLHLHMEPRCQRLDGLSGTVDQVPAASWGQAEAARHLITASEVPGSHLHELRSLSRLRCESGMLPPETERHAIQGGQHTITGRGNSAPGVVVRIPAVPPAPAPAAHLQVWLEARSPLYLVSTSFKRDNSFYPIGRELRGCCFPYFSVCGKHCIIAT